MLGSYTLVLALALLVAARLRVSPRTLAATGSLVFAAGSLVCGIAGSLGLLLAARSAQAAGGAALLVGAFALVDGGGAGRRWWTAAAIFGFAAGPALGGVLTEAIDWRAIFLFQIPVAIAAAAAAWRSAPPLPSGAAAPFSWPVGPAVALALLSAALVGVLFLLVLMLVTGWSVSPLGAAAAVSVLPVAALAASRVPGPPRVRASAGAVLVGGGVLALASLPSASPWWTVVPQVMAGAGMGLALPALAGELLPERTPSDAAWLLSARHAGITVALALLAPVAAAQLDTAVADTREQGAALVLDARLPPLDKLSLAGALVGDLDPVDPRGELQRSLDAARAGIDAEDRAEYATLAERADDALVAGVQDAFELALAICGVLALLAALATLPRERLAPVAAAAAAALVLAGGARLAQPALTPEPIRIADPCQERALPGSGGLEGALQDTALVALDRAACRFGSSREELALALVDESARDAYEREYGVDLRGVGGLLGAVLGL